MRFGVDLSEFQTGVDYERAVREGGVTFAILRGGYSRTKDAEFERHWKGFSEQKIPLGVYQYSYAKSAAEARREAEAALEWCRGKRLSLPLFLDLEEAGVASLGKSVCTEIALAWCGRIEEDGVRAGVYASTNWWRRCLDGARIREKYAVWCADWGKTPPDVPGTAIWQFGGSTNLLRPVTVAGIPGTVDQDDLLEDLIGDGVAPDPGRKEETTVTITLSLLREGDTGEEVRTVQRLLEAMGYSVGPSGADGIFGADTRAGVLAFQKAERIDRDGIVGRDTWTRLLK